MITAFVLINVDVSAIPETASQIAEIPGVSEVHSVTGDYDLIAVIRVLQHEDLAETISNRLSKVAGVKSTSTHIAFRAFSQHDLELGFDLGLEGGA